tara:strand:- start:248 stop:1807 length:1560 start_codon:yes stop_codon:yes gene_type:complete
MAYKRLEITRPKGIITDLSPYELPNEAWSSGNNVNFRNFRTNREIGYSQVFPDLSIQPLFALSSSISNVGNWFYGSTTDIYKTNGTTQTNITRETGAVDVPYTGTFVDGWTGDVFNGVAVMNNTTDAPQYYDTVTGKMKELTGWPTDYSAAVVRPFKNYLIALNITDDSGENIPSLVRWSNGAPVGSVPADWDSVNPASQAGENSLADSGGVIIDGRALSNTFMIYKSDSVWGMQFIGGSFTFSFRKIFSDQGALSSDCITEFEGKHFVVAPSDVYVHDGTSKNSIITNKIKKELFSRINESFVNRVKCVADTPNKEVWIYYPSTDSASGLCDKALVWNWETNDWSPRDLENIAHIAVGDINPVESDTWDGSPAGSWNDDTSAWGEGSYNPSQTELLLSNYTDSKFFQANLSTTLDGLAYSSFVERTGLDFQDDLNYKYVNSITPHLLGEGTVNITVGSEDRQGQGILWSQPVVFEIDADYKADFRVSGRYISIRIESNTSTSWSLTGYTVEYKEVGER